MKNLLTDLRNLSLFFALITIIGCGGDIEVIKETYDSGSLKAEYQRKKSDFTKHGWYKGYDEAGWLYEESTYQDDALHGTRKIYHENGNLNIQEEYVEGYFQGPYVSYFPNSTMEMEGQYQNNAMEGEWKFYHENGQLHEVVRFKGNEENGPFIEYHLNGNLKAEGAYLNGDFEHGELKLYDEDGELERVMNCVEGRCETTWKKEETTE
ncbi:MAG: toxin-antitoxin system YwqK family antitoxin [Bacteroidota bacterium]